MIVGLTHEEDGVQVKVTKYRGKISTGYAPNEGPNKRSSPEAAGFFRMLKEVITNRRVGTSQKMVSEKEWVDNPKIQKILEASYKPANKMPRRIEIVCLYKTVAEMWESSMAMYSGSEGLLCKSHGKGTIAKYLEFDPSGDRKWTERKFDGKLGCAYDECPDKKAGKCKPIGLLKCFPTIDMAPNPYRFETRSINTIIGIESSFQDLDSLLKAAHVVRQLEAGKPLPYDGFFGAKLLLKHKKTKSGGRDVFITDLMPTAEFTDSVMEPIKRGLADKSKSAKMIGAGSSLTTLEDAGSKLLEAEDVDVISPIPLDVEDEKSIATGFGADADSLADKAVETLMNDDGKSPEK